MLQLRVLAGYTRPADLALVESPLMDSIQPPIPSSGEHRRSIICRSSVCLYALLFSHSIMRRGIDNPISCHGRTLGHLIFEISPWYVSRE